MADIDEDDFKVKGAAQRAEAYRRASGGENPSLSFYAGSSSSRPSSKGNEAEAVTGDPEPVQEDVQDSNEEQQREDEPEEQPSSYRWCKCTCDPAQHGGMDHYFIHLDSRLTTWNEPSEPYWLWVTETQDFDENGLHHPTASSSAPATSGEPDPNYYGYNPKIHGRYDPNAPYAQYHNRKREEEATAEQVTAGSYAPAQNAYAATGTFNRFTGNFQGADKSMERHSDFNKTGRQLSAHFDVDAAANAHGGQSLKDERRNMQFSKKQIKKMAEDRRARKEQKRLDWLKS